MFENLMAQAASLLSSAPSGDVADATRAHVDGTDPATLSSHLTTGAQNLDGAGLAQLGQSLLAALAQNGHDETKVHDSGVDTSAAAGGDQANVIALIEHARQNPAALRDAAVTFAEKNPQALAQIPGLVEGVVSRLQAR